MRAYYEDEHCTIYHGDCRDILPTLGKFDLLLTDPPYGVDFKGKTTKHTAPSGSYISGDSNIGPDVVRLFLKQSTRGIVFCGIRLLHDYPPPDDIGGVFCPSGAGIGKWGFTCFHPILFYGPRPRSENGGCRPTSFSWHGRSDNLGHPCAKPLKWLSWCLGLAGQNVSTVIDPFAGSGTTGRAAKDLGKRAVLIEREEKYCEIAAGRMAQEVLELCP